MAVRASRNGAGNDTRSALFRRVQKLWDWRFYPYDEPASTLAPVTLTFGGTGSRILQSIYEHVPEFPVRGLSASIDLGESEQAVGAVARRAQGKADELGTNVRRVRTYAPSHRLEVLNPLDMWNDAFKRNPLLATWNLHVLLTLTGLDDPRIHPDSLNSLNPDGPRLAAQTHALLTGDTLSVDGGTARTIDVTTSVTGGTGLGIQLGLVPYLSTGRSPFEEGAPRMWNPSARLARSLEKAKNRHYWISGVWGDYAAVSQELVNAVTALGLYVAWRPSWATTLWFDNVAIAKLVGMPTVNGQAPDMPVFTTHLNPWIGRAKLAWFRAWNEALVREGVADAGTQLPAADSNCSNGGASARHATLGYHHVPYAMWVTPRTLARAIARAIIDNACGYPVDALRSASRNAPEIAPGFLFFIRAPHRMERWVKAAVADALGQLQIEYDGQNRVWFEYSRSDAVEVTVMIHAPSLIPMGLVRYYNKDPSRCERGIDAWARRQVDQARREWPHDAMGIDIEILHRAVERRGKALQGSVGRDADEGPSYLELGLNELRAAAKTVGKAGGG